jgi:integrase
MKLTMNRIDGLDCPASRKDRIVFDDEQRGLGVRITASGGKSYLVQTTFNGCKRRIALGSCGAISLADARLAARDYLGQIARGHDPAALDKKRALDAAFTLRKLIADWQALHLANKKPRYAGEAARALSKAFRRHLDEPASSLDRKAVVRAIDARGTERPQMASRTAAYGKACYAWAVKRGTLSENPFANLPVAPAIKRDRVLSDAEIAAIWHATEEPTPFNGVVRLLLLTGQRLREVAGLTLAELAANGETWTIPGARTKNSRAHIVPLSTPAQDVLRSAPDFDGGLFPIGHFTRPKAALDAASGVSDWVLHDLRRTTATGLQRLGVRLEVTEALLNHVSGSRGGIVGVYQRHDWAGEKRAALDAWGAKVLAIAEGREAHGNIIALPERA